MSTLISRLAATFESPCALEGEDEEEESSPLDAAMFLYGEAIRLLDDAESGRHSEALQVCDVAPGDIKALLECCLSTLDEVQGGEPDGSDIATRDALRADASVLLGRAVEWCEPLRALALFQRAAACCPGHAEAHLQCGRALCHRAATAEDLVRAEEHLRRAVDAEEEEEERGDEDEDEEEEVAGDGDEGEEDEEGGVSDATGPQAKRLLARLLLQHPDKRREAHALLAAMGYTHALAHSLTSCDFLAKDREAGMAAAAVGEHSLAAAAALAVTGPRSSARIKAAAAAAGGAAPCAFAFDDVLPPAMLTHLQGALNPGAPFWREHAYASPGTGFFSYQHALPKWRSEAGEGGSSGPSSSSSFEQVLLRLRATAAVAVPAVQKARFAEWWAHLRPHSSGHALHFDYTVDPATQQPRHPVVSTVTYLSAQPCGGPTLVTDQTMPEASAAPAAEAASAETANSTTAKGRRAASEAAARTHRGWVVVPRQNRCLVFRGSQLHCVLPGVGASPRAKTAADAAAASAAAAVKKKEGGRDHKRRKRQPEGSSSSSSSAHTVQAAASEANDERRLTFMVAFWVDDPRAPPLPDAYPNGQSWPTTFTAPLQAAQTNSSATPAGAVSGVWRATPNPEAVWPVAEVWEPLESCSRSSAGCGRGSRSGGRGRRLGLDLLAPSCFADCAALNSGLFLAGPTGACSLNCGGTCPACQTQASRSNSSSSSSSAEGGGGGLKQAHSSKSKKK
jgi:hypothetical protein